MRTINALRIGSVFAIVALSCMGVSSCACTPARCSHNPPVIFDDDAGLDDAQPPPPDVEEEGTVDKCTQACKRLGADDLQCPEALGFPGGKSCAEVCTQTQGTPFAMKADCVIVAKTIKEVQSSCHIRCIRE